LLLAGCSPQPDAEVVREIPWALVSRPLVIDTHTHTRFSDGKYTVDEVVERAATHGCDALAITDHSDLGEEAATPAYFAAIREARQKFPGLILFGGIEWNIPPYDGREHVTVLLDPSIEEAHLGAFKELYERSDASAEDGLEWLAQKAVSEKKAALIYNHPSRKDDDPDENLHDYLHWRNTNHLFIGFEGAPGHQKSAETGSYRYKLKTLDRWDPVAAEIGGVWDKLLDQGHNVWAALAVSDFHNDKLDYSPCEFARTHVYPEEISARGILAGLRAGSFWADHGQILDELLFTLSAPGLPLPLTPGETMLLHARQPLHFTVLLQRSNRTQDASLVVELIGNGRTGQPELLFSQSLAPDENRVDWTLAEPVTGADGHSAYVRIRIRHSEPDEPNLLAYTNPIRVILR